MLEITSLTEMGAVRSVNQDSILVYHKPARNFALLAVADGMGGYSEGEKASRAITAGLREWLDEATGAGLLDSPTAIFTGIGEKLSEISAEIHRELNVGQVCGSTCALLFLHGDMYGLLSVGDSRIYLAQGRSVEQLTQDDVWENLPDVRRSCSEAERARNPNFGKLTRAVGSAERMAYSMNTGRLEDGDVFALCSDGVYKMCSEGFLKRELRGLRRRSLDEGCERIRDAVYRGGARDNLSLILARYTQ